MSARLSLCCLDSLMVLKATSAPDADMMCSSCDPHFSPPLFPFIINHMWLYVFVECTLHQPSRVYVRRVHNLLYFLFSLVSFCLVTRFSAHLCLQLCDDDRGIYSLSLLFVYKGLSECGWWEVASLSEDSLLTDELSFTAVVKRMCRWFKQSHQDTISPLPPWFHPLRWMAISSCTA